MGAPALNRNDTSPETSHRRPRKNNNNKKNVDGSDRIRIFPPRNALCKSSTYYAIVHTSAAARASFDI